MFDSIKDLIFVPRCAVCNERMDKADKGICERCYDRYGEEKSKYCDFCGMEACLCFCQPQQMLINGCTEYRKCVFYSTDKEVKTVRAIVYSVKRRHNLPLINFIASEIAGIDVYKDENTFVTYTPRSFSNLQKYGYDHAKLIAKEYARLLGLKMICAFKTNIFHKRSEQKLLNYNQRAVNMRGAYLMKRGIDLKGKTVILVDDVVTSGATLGECISMLYAAGASNVICRSFAHTYRKNKSKSD